MTDGNAYLTTQLFDHEASPISVLKNLAVVAITVGVIVKVLPLVRSVKITDDTKKLLIAEHGEDLDEGATDDKKIEYQMQRRLISGDIFWNTGSLEKDFKFFCANRHPVLQFFAEYGEEKQNVYGLGKFVLFIIEANAIMIGFFVQMELLPLQALHLHWFWNGVWTFLLATFLPMVGSNVQFELLACPCQSSSAAGGHMSHCATFCKFSMGPVMRLFFIFILLNSIWVVGLLLPWDLKLAAMAGRCQGYLLFFLQNYVMWQYVGKWKKHKEKAEALLGDKSESALLSKGIRGETCQQAACKLLVAYLEVGCALVVLLLLFGAWLAEQYSNVDERNTTTTAGPAVPQ